MVQAPEAHECPNPNKPLQNTVEILKFNLKARAVKHPRQQPGTHEALTTVRGSGDKYLTTNCLVPDRLSRDHVKSLTTPTRTFPEPSNLNYNRRIGIGFQVWGIP